MTASKPVLAEVVTLHPCLDVVAMLREMADNIEKGDGEHGEVRSVTACVETNKGKIEVFGWADTGILRSIGVLHLGIERLTRMRLRQFED